MCCDEGHCKAIRRAQDSRQASTFQTCLLKTFVRELDRISIMAVVFVVRTEYEFEKQGKTTLCGFHGRIRRPQGLGAPGLIESQHNTRKEESARGQHG